MKCDGAKELFSEYIEGSVDYALAKIIGEHIEGCQSCTRDFAEFKETWGMLNSLPEVEPPANFRHDVVMRVVRANEERNGARAAAGFRGLLRRLFPLRTVGLTAASILLALVLLKGSVLYDDMKAGISPAGSISGTPSRQTAEITRALKDKWQHRQLERNTLWVTIEPKRTEDGRMLYRVLLSINDKALKEGVTCARIGAQVWLLPQNQFGQEAMREANLVWHGNILSSAPLLVPVIQGPGESANLLVVWRFRHRNFSQIIYIPSQSRVNNAYDLSSRNAYSATDGDIFRTIQSVAEEYGVPIIASTVIDDVTPATTYLSGRLDESLRSMLTPSGLDWLESDRAVYIDRVYHY